jgi:hypothetical protein
LLKNICIQLTRHQYNKNLYNKEASQYLWTRDLSYIKHCFFIALHWGNSSLHYQPLSPADWYFFLFRAHWDNQS